MLQVDLVRFAQALSDPIILVRPSGEIVVTNNAARALLPSPAGNLFDLVSDNSDLKETLTMMSRSSEPLAAGLTIRAAGGDEVQYRCDGALLRRRQGDDPAILILRLRPRETASSQFLELNSKVESLDREIRSRRRVEALIRAQVDTLEAIISGQPLSAVLERLIETVQSDSRRPIIGSILLYDRETQRLHHGARSRLPDEYVEAIDNLQAGEGVGSCGTAAHRGRPVVVSDIAVDPLWRDFRELALRHDLRACWSTPILSSNGEVMGTFAVYLDEPSTPTDDEIETISLLTRTASIAIERARTDEQRAELHRRERTARAEAETANKIKDEFLATVSHELRTPLTAILGWSRLLRDASRDPDITEAVNAISSSARAQAQIIEDLLDFSRIASDRLQIEPRTVDLAGVVNDAVAIVQPAADMAGVKIRVHTEPLSGRIEADAGRLRQVVWNLLVNAVKFAPGGNVEIRVTEAGSGARISVRDNGEGIDRALLPRIFDRFVQGDATSRRRHGGLGLGLAIARKLVELHGGTVEAESDGLGKGATFLVQIPYAARRAASATNTQALVSTSGTGLALSGVHLLLVEDEASSREVLSRLLDRAGAAVTSAASATEAISAYRAARPDLVVSDIAMPGMDGFELLAELRRGESEADRVPAIALTAYARPADRERALTAGFAAHISKPVDPDELVETLRGFLRQANVPRSPV